MDQHAQLRVRFTLSAQEATVLSALYDAVGEGNVSREALLALLPVRYRGERSGIVSTLINRLRTVLGTEAIATTVPRFTRAGGASYRLTSKGLSVASDALARRAA